MDIKHICDLIDKRQDELYNLLSELIKINSENFGEYGNEKECAEYIHKICQELGLESDIYSPLDVEGFVDSPDYFPGRNLETRYNVTARWRGAEDVDELMLMGHTDTVEIGNVENWSCDPLSGEIRDGKIFGRGACDDKYAIATVLFLIKLFKEEGFVPKANLLFSAYSDEELGGSHGAMASMMKYPCKSIVNMDGRENQIWHCASGGQVASYCFHTKEPVDSAEITAKAFPIVMEEMEKFKNNRREEFENNRFYAGTVIARTSLRYDEVSAGKKGIDRRAGQVMFTYYTDKTKDEIYAEFAELEKSIASRLEPMGIIGDGFVPYTRFFHYGFCEPDCDNIKLMVDTAKEVAGTDLLVCGSCLSDLSIILKYSGQNAYAFGAGRDFSKDGGPHQPDEFIECEQFLKYTKTIAAYILKMLG